MPKLRVYLIGCGKSKRPVRSPARDLYTGTLFKKQLQYAEAFGNVVYILSALHGLVPVDAPLDPYDFTLNDLDDERLAAWRRKVRAELKRRHPPGTVDLFLLAGKNYDLKIPGVTKVYSVLPKDGMFARVKFLSEALAVSRAQRMPKGLC